MCHGRRILRPSMPCRWAHLLRPSTFAPADCRAPTLRMGPGISPTKSCPLCPSPCQYTSAEARKGRLWRGASSLFLPASSLHAPHGVSGAVRRRFEGDYPSGLPCSDLPPWFPERHISMLPSPEHESTQPRFFLNLLRKSRSIPGLRECARCLIMPRRWRRRIDNLCRSHLFSVPQPFWQAYRR